MAPDRGSDRPKGTSYASIPSSSSSSSSPPPSPTRRPSKPRAQSQQPSNDQDASSSSDTAFLTPHAPNPQSFTFRSVLAGALIGIIICFSNTYFGLQTGWVSGMAMPAALIGFSYFKLVARYIAYPFTPVENVLVQTVAGAVGTMPLGCGFVGVLPALNFLLAEEENGPLRLGLGKLVVWAVGVCFFGVFLAVPLRREVIVREKLRFPSGTATALMIGVLHGDEKVLEERTGGGGRRKVGGVEDGDGEEEDEGYESGQREGEGEVEQQGGVDPDEWKAKMRLLVVAFGGSSLYTLASYFLPQLHAVPVFGRPLADAWLWTLNPSPAYVGQGIIMGPATTTHMLLGALLGWALLSPLAKSRGWAAGPVDDWETGSKGWIVWVSLAIMLADSLVNLGWLVLRPVVRRGPRWAAEVRDRVRRGEGGFAPRRLLLLGFRSRKGEYAALAESPSHAGGEADDEPDAPPDQLVSTRVVILGLLASVVLCTGSIHYTFHSLIPLPLTLLSILLALLLSIMGVRALGETDLNPVSGISKLTQLLFALLVPSSNKNAVIINLIAGAVSESGALQAGDMMQDLKTGHLLGASPKAQFWGQIIGSFVGAVVSAGVYRLYTHVYAIPGGMFQVPTGYVWIFTARLVTGKGLPPMAWQWALGFGGAFALLTAARIRAQDAARSGWWARRLHAVVPGGIAVAVGMYNTPSFTLARFAGGMVSAYWVRWRGREEAPVVVLASGLILGEGLVSIVNLGLAALGVPHA